MDMKRKAEKISHMHVPEDVKIKLFRDLILDCYNEMEAQDQNMHPEIQHNSAEGLRVAKNYLRRLLTH
jgi:hypothetical protein